MDALKVLLVDDDANVLNGYSRSLHKQFQLETASSAQEALEILKRSSNFAVVISDMVMPGMSGLKLLSMVRDLNPDTVRIMLTGNADQQTVIDAINQGEIYKFLTKPCDASAIGEAIADGIQRYKKTKRNQAMIDRSALELKGLSQELSFQAKHDPLTGLNNRQSFEIRLYKALETALNNNMTHAVCYLDIDYLHIINDGYGIDIGDKLLKEIATKLQLGRRRDDMVARLGGDEFAVLLNDCNLEQARRIVEKINHAISEIHLEKDNKVINITASMGLTPITGENESATTIIRTAEAACSIAKEKGLSTLHIADESDDELKERLGEVLLVSDINQALDEDRFKLYFQTIAPLASDAPTEQHYEILLRMLHENGEICAPNLFLPAAERYHLTPKIDCWVIRKCVEKLSENPAQLAKLSLCSINLSGHSLGSDEVLNCIIDSFASSPIAPNNICFEVTETAAILRLEAAMKFITALKARGFLFALDDFGSGYSSFAYLRDLPVDFLKIDGTFVKNIDKDQLNRAMVKTISELGRAMGIQTIAEFVENEAIHKCLQELQVDYAQGYFVGRPLPWENL
jgi:diguanylate cyclase (GGDEF)-like protein